MNERAVPRRHPTPAVSSSRRAIGRAVKVAAAAVDRFRAPSPGVVVLLYHRVGGRSSSEVDLDAAVFAAQMAFLADSTDVVRLERALEELASPPVTAPRRPAVVVTFDDGTDDFVDVAVPILLQQRIPVTLYLATAFVDEGGNHAHNIVNEGTTDLVLVAFQVLPQGAPRRIDEPAP